MANAPVRTRVLTLLREARADLETLAGAASDADRQAVGSAQRWALKDTVCHIGIWQARQAEQLSMAARGEKPRSYPNDLELNDQDFLENRERSWEEIWAEAERRHAALVAAVEALSEEQLSDPERYTWRPGQPISSIVQGTYWHMVAHVAQYYADRGDLAEATRIQEALAAKLGGPDRPPAERGTAIYNLACFYATTGRQAEALALLPEAFALQPDLAEWAKQDTDMDSLRDRPEYRALYA